VKAVSDELRLTTLDMIVGRRREVVEKQTSRLGLFVKRGALEWAHARYMVVKIAKTFLRQTDAERAHWTYIVELVLTEASVVPSVEGCGRPCRSSSVMVAPPPSAIAA
jgi:hypothetical protein